MDVCDFEFRRQCCRERIDQIRDDFRRVQRPRQDSKPPERDRIVQMRSVWERVRRQVPQRVPVFRS